MATYLIEGKRVQVDGQLSESEIDEIGASIRATAKPKQGSIVQDIFQAAKQGLTNLPSILTAGSAEGQGTFAGAFPSQPELAPISTVEGARKAMGVTRQPATTETGKYVMPMVEAVADPLSYAYPGSILQKAGTAAISGLGGEVGGELGGGLEKAITGTETGVGRGIGAVTGSVGAPLAGAPFKVTTGAAADLSKQLWSKYQAVKIDPAGAENAVAAGAAKRLLEQAAKAQGASNIDDIISDINKASQYVTGTDAPLLVSMINNPVIKEQVVRLAKTNPQYRAQIQAELDKVAQAIDSKASTIFGDRFAPVTDTGLKLTNVAKRKEAINGRLEALTDPLTAPSKGDIGKAVENLVEAKKATVMKEMSPQYEGLKASAREANVTMPAEATEALYNFVETNRLRDIFGRGSAADNKVLSILRPKETPMTGIDANIAALEKAAGNAAPTNKVFGEMSFDDVDSLKRLINEQQRKVKDPSQLRKLDVLEEQLDAARGQYIPEWSDKLKGLDLQYYEKVGVPFSQAQGIKDIDSAKYASQVANVIVKDRQALRDFVNVAGKEGVQIAENAVIAKAYEAAVKDGLLSGNSLSAFIKKNSDVLNEMEKNGSNIKQLLSDSLLDDRTLKAQRARLDVQAKAAEKRIADNYLTKNMDDGVAIPDYATLLTGVLNTGSTRNKLAKDLADLSPEASQAVRGSLRAELAAKALDDPRGGVAFLQDPKNRAGIDSIMGNGYQESLMKISKLSDNLKKADIERLSLELEKSKVDSVGARLAQMGAPGLDVPYITSTIRDRISSPIQKGVRLLSRVNVARTQEQFDQQVMQLLTDPQGVKKLANVAQTMDFTIKNPVQLEKIMSTLFDSMPASVYIGLQGEQGPAE
jgi:hypothetical protein